MKTLTLNHKETLEGSIPMDCHEIKKFDKHFGEEIITGFKPGYEKTIINRNDTGQDGILTNIYQLIKVNGKYYIEATYNSGTGNTWIHPVSKKTAGSLKDLDEKQFNSRAGEAIAFI